MKKLAKRAARKTLRATLWFGLFLGVALLGLRFAALPYAEGQLVAALQGAGMRSAVLERTGLGFYTLSYALRPAPGQAVMAELNLKLLASLLERKLHLASATLVLDSNWQVPGYEAEASDEPAIKVVERPLFLPALVAQLDKLEVTTPLGLLTASMDYAPQQLKAQWQWQGYTGELTLEPQPEGAYNIAATGTGAASFTLDLQGGRASPILTATAGLPQYILGPVSLQDIKLTLNADAKPGYVWPYAATATLVGKPVEAKGSLDALAQTAHVEASGDFKLGSFDAVGIKSSFDVGSFLPPVINNGGTFAATAVQAGGLPLIAPRATFGFRSNRLNLQSASAGLFGGRVSLAPAQIAVPLEKAEVKASFEALELAQVLQLAAVDGLGGDGKLSGTIPVTYTAGRITLGQAQVKALEAGQIRYAPAETPAFLAPGGSGAILGEIFSDFRYSGLTLNLGGTLGDNLTLGVRLEGNNPSFYNGHSVAFNLNLSGAIESLLADGLQSFQLSPEAIKQLSEEGQRP